MSRVVKRSANYTAAECDVLLQHLEANPDLIQNKLGGKVKNAQEHWQAWGEIAEKVTEVGGYLGDKRNGRDLKKKWMDMKYRLKTKLASNDIKASVISRLTPLEERILALLPLCEDSSAAKTETRDSEIKAPDLRIFSFQNESNSQQDAEDIFQDIMSENEGSESDLVNQIKSSSSEAKKRRISKAFNSATGDKNILMKKTRQLTDEEQLSELCASQRQLNIELASMKEILKKCQASIEKLALLKRAELRLKCAKYGVEFDDLFD